MEPKKSPWKRKILLETMIFRFHVKFRGCKANLFHFWGMPLAKTDSIQFWAPLGPHSVKVVKVLSSGTPRRRPTPRKIPSLVGLKKLKRLPSTLPDRSCFMYVTCQVTLGGWNPITTEAPFLAGGSITTVRWTKSHLQLLNHSNHPINIMWTLSVSLTLLTCFLIIQTGYRAKVYTLED